jgi:hypothetical protein
MVACALDVGWVLMTRTQLHAGSDSASLAGGTELLPGLGTHAYKTPSEVATAVNSRAAEFAAKHYAGDVPNIHVVPARDVAMGRAKMVAGVWQFNWGSTPYNAVQVTTRRSVEGSDAGDGPLPLIIAPALGHEFSTVEATATAVIMPSKGVSIPPGSGINSALSPFAIRQQDVEKYKRAQAYYTGTLGSNPALIDPTILDAGEDPQTPLFYKSEIQGNKTVYSQLFGDQYGVTDPALDTPGNITTTPDGVLEMSIYPTGTGSAGNFGTVDIGGLDNSTQVLKRQIEFGPSEEDLDGYPNNEIDFSQPLTLQGDTGISAGIESSVEAIVGQCRAVLLYSIVVNPGNNASFTIVDMVGMRIMYVTFNGNNKRIVVQPCVLKDPGGLPDFEDDDGSDDSVFSPLILAQ